MKISLNWLREYVDFPHTAEELAETLTALGLEIEGIERPGADISGVLVGQILSIEKHPEADKIVVCKTDVGGPETLQICCGATNMKVGDKVPTAVDGALLPGNFKIANRKMRGVESQGMMCSAKELGVAEDSAGLLILPPDTPVGEDIRKVLGLDDAILEIEVTPNRADWASMIGVAREVAAITGAALRLPENTVDEDGPPVGDAASVTVQDTALCRRYMARVLEGVTIGPSPEWLQKRLRAAGQRSINNVVDITNFVLLETGQPLHAFNLDHLVDHRIVVRRAAAGEKIRTLDGEERSLTEEVLVIADAARPQCVAGVMGGAESEVAEGCTRVLLESAWFAPSAVRRASKLLNLSSESSQRFQRGADPEMAAWALDRAAGLIHKIAGGHLLSGRIDAYNEPFVPAQVTLRFERVNSFLGADISPLRQVQDLQRLGFEVLEESASEARFRVPLRRNDVSREVDLIEEIARIEGFDSIPNTLPQIRAMEAVLAPEDKKASVLRRVLVQAGLTEVRNWSFTNASQMERAGLAETPVVALANPLSEKQSHMRASLVPSLLENAAYNLNRGAARIAIFEIAPSYHPAGEDALPQQKSQLGVVLAGPRSALHWSMGEGPQADFYDVKGIAEQVLAHAGLTGDFSELEHPSLQPGQSARIVAGGAQVGYLGKLSPAVAKEFDLEKPVFVLSLELDPLWRGAIQHVEAQELSPFPASIRDLAVVVDSGVPAGELVAIAAKAGGSIVQRVQVFDVYAGKNIPEGKKSIALRLTFQSMEGTLTEEKITKAASKVIRTLEHRLAATLR
jgi:phenylalanyl-tRNA synthetase beta chain